MGEFPTDVSIYGVRDLAGGMRQWAGDPGFGGSDELRPVRGGGWSTHVRLCRAANRFGFEPWLCRMYIGFRMARDLPGA